MTFRSMVSAVFDDDVINDCGFDDGDDASNGNKVDLSGVDDDSDGVGGDNGEDNYNHGSDNRCNDVGDGDSNNIFNDFCDDCQSNVLMQFHFESSPVVIFR